jgi:hypothetical protein
VLAAASDRSHIACSAGFVVPTSLPPSPDEQRPPSLTPKAPGVPSLR